MPPEIEERERELLTGNGAASMTVAQGGMDWPAPDGCSGSKRGGTSVERVIDRLHQHRNVDRGVARDTAEALLRFGRAETYVDERDHLMHLDGRVAIAIAHAADASNYGIAHVCVMCRVAVDEQLQH